VLLGDAHVLLPHHQNGMTRRGHCCGWHPTRKRRGHVQGHAAGGERDAVDAAGPANNVGRGVLDREAMREHLNSCCA
jgi:hypothetical protein